MKIQPEPLVAVYRNQIAENVHYGHFVVCDRHGNIQTSTGDPQLISYPRSALKLIQAIDLLESGAATRFELDSKHIAMACSSHDGEPRHVNTVKEWLLKINCDAESLACGPALPLSKKAMLTAVAEGNKQQPIYHNCSGKHTAMLTVCRSKGFDISGYDDYDHPVQKTYRVNLSNLIEADADQLHWGIDGCTLPAPALSMQSMARAIAGLADPSHLQKKQRDAIEAMLDAITESPFYLCGTNRLPTMLTEVTEGRVIAKQGAEGFYIALLRDRGLGIALKISDGAERASTVAMLAVLKQIDALRPDELKQLQNLSQPAIRNSRGEIIGEIQSMLEDHY